MLNTIRQPILWLLLVTGILGNLATLMILKYEKTLRTFTKMIFAMEAVCDVMWLTWKSIDRFYRYFHKRLEYFYMFSSAFQYCSLLCAVVVALERMCLLVWPTNLFIRRAALKEAIIICSSLVLFTISLFGIRILWINQDNVLKIVIDNILTNFLPPVVSLIFSAIFIHKFKTRVRRVNPIRQNHMNRLSLLLIKIVVVTSTFDFIVPIPMMCFDIVRIAREKSIEKQVEEVVSLWFQLIWISNFSLKFILYIFFFPNFRKEFFVICKKVRNIFIRNWNIYIDTKIFQRLKSPGVKQIK